MRRITLIGLLVSGLLWLALALFVPKAGQTKVWFMAGQEYLSDYFMTRTTAGHENPYCEPAHTRAYSFLRGGKIVEREGWDLEERDRAYPASALLPLLLFEESLAGAHACTAVMIGVFLAVLTLCLRRFAFDFSLRLIALLMSGPFLFACERGNSIWLSAAGTMLFLLYWDHPRRAVRWLAAAGLAAAAAVKVMPALLGILYLSPLVRVVRREGASGLKAALVDPLVCVAFGLAFFFLPWFFVSGFDAFPDWWRTGHANVAWYAPRTTFGFVGLYRTVMLFAHQAWEGTTGMGIARGLNVACGVAALGLSVWKLPRSRYASVLLATAGVLLLGANMREYTVLYLLPAFLLWLDEANGRGSVLESVAWFVVWTPLQVPFGEWHLYPAANLAFLSLVVSAATRGSDLQGWRSASTWLGPILV